MNQKHFVHLRLESVGILGTALILAPVCAFGNAFEVPPPDLARYQLTFEATW